MKLRLFIACPLTSGLLKKIAFLEAKIEEKTKQKFTWINLDNLHLTILFLGNIFYEDYLKIDQIFNEFKFKPINLKITKIDYGPPNKKRMIWLYLEKNPALEEIKNFFEEKLNQAKIIYKREERNYLPHINLARLKKPNDLPQIEEKLNWSIILNQIALYQSFLNPQGAEYKKLKIVSAEEEVKSSEIL